MQERLNWTRCSLGWWVRLVQGTMYYMGVQMPAQKGAILRAKREQREWFSRGQYQYDTNSNLSILYGTQTVATWRIWLNRPCVAVMPPHVNLL